jgi:hypothetical protein
MSSTPPPPTISSGLFCAVLFFALTGAKYYRALKFKAYKLTDCYGSESTEVTIGCICRSQVGGKIWM